MNKKTIGIKNEALFLVIATIAIAVSLVFLHNKMVFYNNDQFVEHREEVALIGGEARINFNLHKDSYLLKTKHLIKDGPAKEVFVNDLKIDPKDYLEVRKRGIINTTYIHLPEKTIEKGDNSIAIYFPQAAPPDIDISLTNYRRSIGDDIYILFKDSRGIPKREFSFLDFIIGIGFISLLFASMVYFLRKFLDEKMLNLFLYQVYSILPFIFLFLALCIASILHKTYSLVFSPRYFWMIGIVIFTITEVTILITKLLKEYFKTYKENTFVKKKIIKPPKLSVKRASKTNYKYKILELKEHLKAHRENIYLKRKIIAKKIESSKLSARQTKVYKLLDRCINSIIFMQFSDRCVSLSVILLLICSLLYIIHLDIVAKYLANICYYFLLLGIIIKLIKQGKNIQ